MKTLVIYYSRTNTTKRVAAEIASKLNCDLEEIVDKTSRKGVFGYIKAGRDAALKKLTKIDQLESNLAEYDHIIIGTPIWSWSLSTAVRTFIEENKESIKNFSIFCTQGGSGGEKTFIEVEKFLGKNAKSKLELLTKEVMADKQHEKIDQFISKIKQPAS